MDVERGFHDSKHGFTITAEVSRAPGHAWRGTKRQSWLEKAKVLIVLILLMEEILHHLGWLKPYK